MGGGRTSGAVVARLALGGLMVGVVGTEKGRGPLPRLEWPTKSLYGLGALGSAVKSQLAGLVLLFYNQLVGLDASSVGLVMLIALLVDAFWDPVVGQLSDNTRSRLGRRHPYIYAAAVPSLLFFVATFAPPHGWAASALLLYFLVVTLGSRLCDSLVEIPAAALLPELSRDYDERTGLSSWRYVYRGVIGPALAAFLAFGVFLRGTPTQPYGQLNPVGYAPYALTVGAITLVAVLASALRIPTMPPTHSDMMPPVIPG
jgi:GPH family glycoside/pentoside/hexuronide:cation symporter